MKQSTNPSRMRILFWSETTAQLPFVTGIQRVVRHLGTALEAAGCDVLAVGWNGVTRVVRGLGAVAQADLGFGHTPLETMARHGTADWLIFPETPDCAFQGLNPVQVGRAYGLRTAAIVHDLIPLKLSHLYDKRLSDLFANYFRMLAAADLVVTTTQLVANDFRNFLNANALGIPPIVVIPLGGDSLTAVRSGPPYEVKLSTPLSVLNVGTLEPRKNHIRLLNALRAAQLQSDTAIKLTIVGRHGHDSAYERELFACAAETPGVLFLNSVKDAELIRLFQAHHASVYASYEEGFGLPVVESLWMGLPCLCHAGSSLAEVAPGGGTLMVNMQDEAAITKGLCRLAGDSDFLARLRQEAEARPIGTWQDAAETLLDALRKEPSRRTSIPAATPDRSLQSIANTRW